MMLLAEKLDLILTQKNLAPIAPGIFEKQIYQTNTFKSLEDGIKSIKTVEPDENGVRIIVTENLNVDELNIPVTLLPVQLGGCVIQDIKRSKEGYEIHVVEK
jgi:hypothetical protein